jgi:hypothetical protein
MVPYLETEKDYLQLSKVEVERSHMSDVWGIGWAGTARGSGKAKEIKGTDCYQNSEGRPGVLNEHSQWP